MWFRFQDSRDFIIVYNCFTNFGVTNQALQVSFNFVVEDSMLVFSSEIAGIRCCELLDIFEAISYYKAQAFALHSPRASLPLVTCSSPHRTSKEEDILNPPGHLLLTLGDDFKNHCFLFMYEIY